MPRKSRLTPALSELRLAKLVGAVALLSFTHGAIAVAEDDFFTQFPLVIHCQSNKTQHAFYISRVSEDGVATYVASDRIAGTISLDGHAKAIGSEGGGTCVGKTLAELRASGQAYDLKH